MIKKIEEWLRAIIADELRKVFTEQQEPNTAPEPDVCEPAHWQADDVNAQHELRHARSKRR